MSDVVLNRFRLGPWQVLRDRNRIERTDADGSLVTVRLEPKAVDVLCVLAGRPGETLTRDELLDQVWGGRAVVEGTLSRAILALRQALGDDAKAPTYIETVQKRGYRLLVTPIVAEESGGTGDVVAAPAAIAPAANAPLAHALVASSLEPVSELPDHAAGRSASPRPLARWVKGVAAVVLLAAALLWLAWPRIQLERATSSGLDAMLFRGERAADRDVLREELRYMRAGRVLWVDDEPANNRREITTLEQAGLVVDVATSNAAAGEQMRGREYDVIISDIRRPPPESESAGLDLPRVVVPDRNRLPPLIYYVHKADGARTADGYPVTNKAGELIRLVSNVFRWKQTEPRIRPLDPAAIEMPPGRAPGG